MAIVFKTPLNTKNLTTNDSQNIDSPIGCNLEAGSVEYNENGEYTLEPESADGFSSVEITVDVPSNVNNQEKSVTISTNGTSTITYDANYTGLSSVGITVDVEPDLEAKTVEYTANNTYTIAPSSGKDGISSATVTVNVDTVTPYNEGKAAGIAEQKAKLESATFVSNGTYTKEDGYNSVTVAVPSDINNQNKTATPSTSAQEITADSGYSGLGKVTISAVTAAIDSDIVAGNIKKDVEILGVTGTYDPQPELQDKTVTPSTSQQVISADSGYDGLDEVTVNAVTSSIDANIAAGNIKKDVTILGVTGSYDPQPNLDTLNVTPSTSAQTLTPTSPVDGFDEVVVSAVTSSIDANIVAGNIKDGVTILGVTGTYSGGIPVQGDPFWIKSLEDDNSIVLHWDSDYAGGSNNYDINYSLDGLTWNSVTWEGSKPQTSTFTLDANEYIYFKGDNVFLSEASTNGTLSFNSTKTVDIGGYLCSLLDDTNYVGYALTSRTTFRKLFSFNNVLLKVVNASQLILPSNTTSNCYESMFENCTTLEVAPALPAAVVASSAYKNMFKGCTSLVTPPNIGMKVVDASSCSSMFSRCTSLTTVPSFSVSYIDSNCFEYMFFGCTGITTVPSNLLPATTLYDYCYSHMFDGCTSLTNTPNLPATYISNQTNIYQYMFRDCTSLTKTPILPASSLGSGAYNYMFSGCSNLSEVTCLATTVQSSYSKKYEGWLSGVAATGTFYKNANRTDVAADFVPTGWSVEDYVAPSA